MPRREPVPVTLDDRVAAEFQHEFQSVEDRLVAEAGPPPDTKRLSERDEDEAYMTRDLSVDHDALAERLLTQGLSQEEAEALAVIQEFPDWLPHYMQATGDAVMADQLATMAEFPVRWTLFADIDDPSEMVAKAERIAARVQKRGAVPMMPEQPLALVGG